MSDAADPSGAPATDDAALARLLDAYGRIWADLGVTRPVELPALFRRIDAAQAAILAHLAAHYVRRDRLYDDGPWEPGDGSAYGAALEREGRDAAR